MQHARETKTRNESQSFRLALTSLSQVKWRYCCLSIVHLSTTTLAKFSSDLETKSKYSEKSANFKPNALYQPKNRHYLSNRAKRSLLYQKKSMISRLFPARSADFAQSWEQICGSHLTAYFFRGWSRVLEYSQSKINNSATSSDVIFNVHFLFAGWWVIFFFRIWRYC